MDEYWDRPPEQPGRAAPRWVEARMREKPRSFDGLLYELFGKADSENHMRLAKAFPRQWEEWINWRQVERAT